MSEHLGARVQAAHHVRLPPSMGGRVRPTLLCTTPGPAELNMLPGTPGPTVGTQVAADSNGSAGAALLALGKDKDSHLFIRTEFVASPSGLLESLRPQGFYVLMAAN